MKIAWRWVHGIIFTVIVLIVNLIFGLFGLTLSLGTLGANIASFTAFTFVLIAFVLLPIIYGATNVFLSEKFGDASFPSSIGAREISLFWVNGLVVVVITLLVTTFLAVIGIPFSFAILETGLTGFIPLVFAVFAFIIYPFAVGWSSQELTELIGP